MTDTNTVLGGALLTRARQHHAEKDRVEIPVPEWSDDPDKPTIIYATPMSLANRKAVYKQAKGDDIEVLARIVVMKAQDEDGQRLFKPADLNTLMYHVDAEVVARIAEAIMVADGAPVTIEDAEKN